MVLAYDLETYKNVFTVVFRNVNNPDHTWVFVAHQNNPSETMTALRSFLEGGWRAYSSAPNEELVLVGHNSLEFDDIILRAILTYPNISPQHLWRLAKKLIDRDKSTISRYHDLRYPKNPLWRSIDTLVLTRVNEMRVSLKHAGVVLRHPNLQELPYDPDTELTEEQITTLLNYNHNDVDIQVKFYNAISPLLEMRRQVGNVFGVDVVTANDTEIAKNILNNLYQDRVGTIRYQELKKSGGTPRSVIEIGSCIGRNIKFETPQLKRLFGEITTKRLQESNGYKYQTSFIFDGVEYNVGLGGLHSVDPPGIFETNEEQIIIDADVASYYPNIMLLNRFYPEHLGEDFLDLYRQIVEERLVAKKEGKTNKQAAIRAQGLKIAINSVFGLMGNKYYWLYDPKVLISITISGQLYLLDLIEKLSLGGIQTISANTDGIVCKISANKVDLYYQICKDWEARTGFELEYTTYRKYIRRDVNNYLTIKQEGGVKTKGVFDTQFYKNGCFYNLMWFNEFENLTGKQPEVPAFNKGYDAPIVSYALYQYFVHGIPTEKTIRNHPDIRDFGIAKRVAKDKFDRVYLEDPITRAVQPLPHYNRYIVVKKGGGYLIKVRKNGTHISAVAGRRVAIINQIDEGAVYDIDYNYYIERAEKEIEQIVPKQRTLW